MKSKIVLLSALLATLTLTVFISGCKKETKESCTDGVQNQNETGIDCGGSCTACVSCTDGIQNGNETGVDCGPGACNACAGAKLKTFTYPNIGSETTETYTYDGQGRISTVVYSGAQTGTATYTYGANTVSVEKSGRTVVYTLNAQGFAVTSSQIGGATNSFTYDVEGHLLSDSIAQATYTWSEGNMTSASFVTIQGTVVSGYTHSGKTNTIGNENRGMSFLGKSSKNLENTITTGSSTYQKVYEFDSQNRVAKEDNAATYTYY